MRLPPGPEDLDEEGVARWELPGDQGVDGALLDFAPRDLKDLAEDGGGPKALPGGQELDQVVCQERWFLSGGHAGTVCNVGCGGQWREALESSSVPFSTILSILSFSFRRYSDENNL